MNPDGTVQVIQGSAYICIRSRSNPAFRYCIHVVATNTPPTGGNTQPGGNGSAVTGISISGPSYGLTGSTVSMSYQARPSGAVIKNVQWRSQYPSIASVDANGTVTCHRIGQTCIYVTTQDGRYTNQKTLTVYDPCTEVTTNLQRTAMIAGTTQTLNAAALPRTAMQHLSYSSSNSDVVSVSQYGILTAQALGSAEITVTSVTNPDKQITLTVTVYENPLSNIRANIENGRFRLENAHLEKWLCAASEFMSLHLASDTTNHQDTFDFTEIDGYYTISLTTSSGTFYIGEQFMPISSIPTHTVIMDEIVCPQCEFPYYFQWEIFKTDSGYSIRNAESQYFLCGTGGELRTANLDAILDNPAAYSCTWNIADPASNELYMPVNVNQKEKISSWIYNAGCAVCCAVDVDAYYSGETKGLDWEFWEVRGLGWNLLEHVEFQDYPVSNECPLTPENLYYEKIRKEIDSGHPALIHCIISGTNQQHWVVAYGYINNATIKDDIFVLDPVGADGGVNI